MATVIRAPRSRPQKSGLAMSPSKVVKAYFIAAEREKVLDSCVVLQQLPVPVPQFSSSVLGVFMLKDIVDLGATAEKDALLFTVTELVEVSLSKILVKIPATIAMIIDVIAR